MFAIGLNEYGGPEVLGPVELATPEPAAGEVRVKVKAAGINPVDVMVREGDLAPLFADIEPPYVPGMDIAGVIDEVGNGVDDALIGQAVSGIVDNHGGYGGYSEYVCLPQASVVPVPRNADYPHAASFLMNALTARNALDHLELGPQSTLLVTGAAGAVGGYTVALAREQGVRVIALASPDDESLVRTLGATDFVARGSDIGQAVRSLVPEGVDAVVDGAGLGDATAPAIRDGGTLIVLRPREDDALERGIGITFVNVRERATENDVITRLAEQVNDGVLPLRVAGVYPAREASEAHRRLDAGGVRGRLILQFED